MNKVVKIKDGWHITDVVSGLKLSIKNGKKLSCLHIEHIGKPICNNRDFYFVMANGKFDGTGSKIAVDDCVTNYAGKE